MLPIIVIEHGELPLPVLHNCYVRFSLSTNAASTIAFRIAFAIIHPHDILPLDSNSTRSSPVVSFSRNKVYKYAAPIIAGAIRCVTTPRLDGR